MKQFFCLLLLALSIFPASSQTHTDSLLNVLNGPTRDYVFVTSHRGDWRNSPENSIGAINRVIKMGVDIVEMDIQKTKDGNFILMHDTTLNRTSTGKGNIKDFTVEDFKKFVLKSGNGIKTYERIPTLEEALTACKGKILVNIDKGGTYIREILPIIQKTGTINQVIIKGIYPVNKVIADYGGKSGMLYMPIVDLDKAGADNVMMSFQKTFKPIAYEVLFRNEKNPLLIGIQDYIGNTHLWINTLWAEMCGNHDDELALNDPDKHWGFLLSHKATIIQTDRPADLIHYLTIKGRRKL